MPSARKLLNTTTKASGIKSTSYLLASPNGTENANILNELINNLVSFDWLNLGSKLALTNVTKTTTTVEINIYCKFSRKTLNQYTQAKPSIVIATRITNLLLALSLPQLPTIAHFLALSEDSPPC